MTAAAAGTLRLRVACSFSDAPVTEGVRAAFQEQGIAADVVAAPYGQVVEVLHAPDTASDDVVLAVLRVRDALGPPDVADDGYSASDYERGEAWIGALSAGLRRWGAAGRGQLHLNLLTDRDPPTDPTLADWCARAARTVSATGERYGAITDSWPISFDVHLNRLAHLPADPDTLVDIGRRLARAAWIAYSRSVAVKVIVLDCDDTLWGGACAELGAGGIDHGGPYAAVQRAVIGQRDAGRLLCLASHNVEEDVLSALGGSGPLAAEHISARRTGWQPKAQMISELARELDLGADSVVLLDDNPVQRNAVRTRLQCVRVPEFASPEELVELLDRSWLFDTTGVTTEDRVRATRYDVERSRRAAAGAAADQDAFLRSLQVQVSASELTGDSAVERATQLLARTNQFAHTRDGFRAVDLHTTGPAGRRWMLTVADRIGEYGRVGVLISTRVEDTAHVEVMLLSCRVLGRGVESCLAELLIEDARGLGVDRIRLEARPDLRNEPLVRFVRTLGGRQTGAHVVLDATVDELRRHTPPSHARLVVGQGAS